MTKTYELKHDLVFGKISVLKFPDELSNWQISPAYLATCGKIGVPRPVCENVNADGPALILFDTAHTSYKSPSVLYFSRALWKVFHYNVC